MERSVSFGRESFLCLKIRLRMYSNESLRMTGQLLPFLLGRANTLVTRRWKGRLVEGGEVAAGSSRVKAGFDNFLQNDLRDGG